MTFNNKTLNEIKEHDIENLEFLMTRKAKTHYLKDMHQVMWFMGQCMNTSLSRLGVSIVPGMHEKFVERIMKEKGVQVERRKYEDEVHPCPLCGGDGKIKIPKERIQQQFNENVPAEQKCPECAGKGTVEKREAWRSGIYIYKGNEIVDWISKPRPYRKTGIIVKPGLPVDDCFMVITTVRI